MGVGELGDKNSDKKYLRYFYRELKIIYIFGENRLDVFESL
jgi:hypothetical protein